jgi:transposase
MLPLFNPKGASMNGDIEFWTSHVDAVKRERISASAYARRHGLSLASLYYWRRKLQVAATASAGGAIGKFVALRVLDESLAAQAGHCTLLLGSDLRLELTALPSPAWLLAVAQAHSGAR